MIAAIRKTHLALACALVLAMSLAAPVVPWAYASALAYEGDENGLAYVDEDEDGYDDNTDEWIGFGTAEALATQSEEPPAASSGTSSSSSASTAAANGSNSSKDGGSANGSSSSSAAKDDKESDEKNSNPKDEGKDKDKSTSSAFTFAGTGTTVDNATSSDGVEFFTIKTDDDKVYYLVVDRKSGMDNVYLLNTVTDTDLQALAENGKINLAAPSATAQKAEEKADASEKKDEQPQQQGVPEWLAYLLVVAVVGGGAFAYYRLKVKPEREESKVDENEVRSFESDGIYPSEDFGQYDNSWK